MNATRFDTIARLFAKRRRAQEQGGAQDAAAQDAEHGPTMLFLQAFQAGSVAPKEGADGRYVLTLEQGLGHTVYFSDRPHREVGATPTPQFLAGLGFPEDNPPNAALVVEGAAGETEIAVLALYAPEYDAATRTATYEAEVLQGWERSLAAGFVEASADLDARLPSFGAAHLFIDGCPASSIDCYFIDQYTGGHVGTLATNVSHCYPPGPSGNFCLPCTPWYPHILDAEAYWNQRCNEKFALCDGQCTAYIKAYPQ